jgi:hypothetical protein
MARRPHTLAGRFDDRERGLIEAVCRAEGTTVADLVRATLLPVVEARVLAALRATRESRPVDAQLDELLAGGKQTTPPGQRPPGGG